jgi:hypothetical protein
MKRKLAFALLMSFITTAIISFVLIYINVGFKSHFLLSWAKAWCISYVLAFCAVLFIGPKIQSIIEAKIPE